MSKRNSVGQVQKNNLFNYFSPNSSKSKNSNEFKEEDKSSPEPEVSTPKAPKKKRKRILIQDSSDSDTDSVPTPKIDSKKRKPSDDEPSTPKSSKRTNRNENNNEEKVKEVNGFSGVKEWLHERLDFLKPDKIRDANKLRPDDPNYNPRTLFVPEQFLNKQTPAMRQWWILKSQHADSVLFFKVGKFYELYHMDAVIGVNYLGFSYMKGEFAHSGFPESAFGKMASSLINQGFKVARVEQTETPEMMAERCREKKSSKYDKVVNREICQITTKATCIYGAQLTTPKKPLPIYLLALAERFVNNNVRFGVCFIETSIGNIHLGEFDDDQYNSKLLTLIAEYPPGMVLLEKGFVRPSTIDLFKKSFADVQIEMLASKKEFYSPQTTLEKLSVGCYFKNKDGDVEWPEIFKKLTEDGNYNPRSEFELCLKALGACLWYLKYSEIDIQVFSMKKFHIYEPIDCLMKEEQTKRTHMVLDSVTMENLKIIGGVGYLQRTVDHCVTAFGKRLLQKWLCRPLCDVEKIQERQNAIKELYENSELLINARSVLSKLPDLERQCAKIHIFGNKFCAQIHPDSRAILYEAKTYSKRKIFDLISTINGFKRCEQIVGLFKDCSSNFLIKLTQFEPKGMFPDLTKTLEYFEHAFDHDKAEKDGTIIPQAGVDDEYDASELAIVNIKKELDEYLQEQSKYFGCKINYFGSDKKRFQLEIPENKLHKVTSDYNFESSKKNAKRYSTATTRRLLASIIKAESERANIIQDLNRRIFEKFSERQQQLEQAIQCLMILDVLCGLAEYARTLSVHVCLPEIKKNSQPFIYIENGRHPCVSDIESFIPNDTHLGGDHKNILLLTGPNMGGKSTLMRQVSLIVIIAQIGCLVPASSCALSIVDRIFTRIGAHDEIVQGRSTFLVELTEASVILQHATKHSLVLIDELGRGTSTHDGNAIATAYLKKLTEINCRAIFSTHYHSLVDYYEDDDKIHCGHMSFMQENDDDDDSKEKVIFMYKLTEGKCPKSFGFHAARLAGLPEDVIREAVTVAKEFETISKNHQFISTLLTVTTAKLSRLILENMN